MEANKRKGTSILFVNSKNEVLLFLRDDISSIPYPNCWDILGGHVEEDETPEECIVREMMEEIEVEVKKPRLFQVYDLADRIEYNFWEKRDLDIAKINLHEGQKLKWFSEGDIKNTPDEKIGCNFKPIILEFFEKKPFKN